MISESYIFTAHGHNILYPERPGCQYIGLEGQTVSVSATELKDGLHALLLKKGASAQRAGLQDSIGHFRDENGI